MVSNDCVVKGSQSSFASIPESSMYTIPCISMIHPMLIRGDEMTKKLNAKRLDIYIVINLFIKNLITHWYMYIFLASILEEEHFLGAITMAVDTTCALKDGR